MASCLARFQKLFHVQSRCAVIGVIHVKALPGTPFSRGGSIDELVEHAVHEASVYRDCGIDGLIVENMNDIPYTLRETPEITASMTRICSAVRDTVGRRMPCGVQILAAQNKSALAVAAASNFNFVRAEGFVFSHVADEGLIHSCAGELLRYRKSLGDFSQQVAVLCDIKKKHSSHAITSDVTIGETAKAADFFACEGIIVTGSATGSEPSLDDIEEVARAVPQQPLILGSGVTIDNFRKLSYHCHGVIVGSHFKRGGYWKNDLDPSKIRLFIDEVKK